MTMVRKPKPPRERAARALCTSRGLPENTKFEGRPMWESFLPEVDIVLRAALSAEEWERVKANGRMANAIINATLTPLCKASNTYIMCEKFR